MPRNYRLYLLLFLTFFFAPATQAADDARAAELRSQISSHNQKIAQLEAEIADFQQKISATTKQARTLKGEIGVIDSTIAKLGRQIVLTEQKIKSANLEIERLALEIVDRGNDINRNEEGVRELMRNMRRSETGSVVELVLADNSLSGLLARQDGFRQMERGVAERIDALKVTKMGLEDKKGASESAKIRLQKLNAELADQKKINADARQSKDGLLASTKNDESNYKKLLTVSQVKRDAFLKELFEYESRLRAEIDFSALPRPGRGVLAWPLEAVFLTQRFGRTVDAARLYTSGTHNGIDLRASVGSPIKAAAAGTVSGTGDTDTVCRGASYGKWVLVTHPNGLSTLYAHLSLIKVAVGQALAAGESIGYSGQTGYATGPHLHLTVLASAGVRVGLLPSHSCAGATYQIPLAALNAYLDPEAYL